MNIRKTIVGIFAILEILFLCLALDFSARFDSSYLIVDIILFLGSFLLINALVFILLQHVTTIALIYYTNRLAKDIFDISKIESNEVSIKKNTANYEDVIDLENFIKPMNAVEFLDFLNKDKYGNDNPDKQAILNLLSLIKDKPGFEEKERLIYMKLSSLNN